MPKIKTSELIDLALDWAVAKCDQPQWSDDDSLLWVQDDEYQYSPSTKPAQGQPIMEQEKIATSPTPDGQWHAYAPNGTRWVPRSQDGVEVFNWTTKASGPTMLIAGMRCYVASKLGEEVEVPEGLQS